MAFELFVEWLDDNAPGCLVSHERMHELYREACDELGISPLGTDVDRAMEHAEADLTVIGHTTLKNGVAIASHEWFLNECDPEVTKAIKLRSIYEAYRADIHAAVAELHHEHAGDAGACSDEDCDCKRSLEIRLQLSKSGGNWNLHTGDPGYDTDHSGFWGASSVGVSADEDIAAVVDELLGAALDAMAEALS